MGARPIFAFSFEFSCHFYYLRAWNRLDGREQASNPNFILIYIISFCSFSQLLASYIGEFQTHRQFPTLTEKFLLIPYVSDKIDPKTHPQVVVSNCMYTVQTQSNLSYECQKK